MSSAINFKYVLAPRTANYHTQLGTPLLEYLDRFGICLVFPMIKALNSSGFSSCCNLCVLLNKEIISLLDLATYLSTIDPWILSIT